MKVMILAAAAIIATVAIPANAQLLGGGTGGLGGGITGGLGGAVDLATRLVAPSTLPRASFRPVVPMPAWPKM